MFSIWGHCEPFQVPSSFLLLSFLVNAHMGANALQAAAMSYHALTFATTEEMPRHHIENLGAFNKRRSASRLCASCLGYLGWITFLSSETNPICLKFLLFINMGISWATWHFLKMHL